jgi:hypothetical protein
VHTPHLHRAERGSQSLELAMATPVLVLLATTVLAVGQVVLGTLATAQDAALAARLAATAADDDVLDRFRDVAPDVALALEPPDDRRRPGDLVTATASRHVAVLWLPAPGLPVSAAATARVERAATPP